MVTGELIGLGEFLRDYPSMAVRPSPGKALVLKGSFTFVANSAEVGNIRDAFDLEIEVPKAFPKDLPAVRETTGKIPRIGEFHVNADDGTLCLGSPLAVLLKLSSAPNLNGFAEKCLVPYLFAISHKLRFGGPLPFGELAHGAKGMLEDYVRLFRLRNPQQARYTLRLLGMKKRRANKLACPCGCGVRLGKCKFNLRLRGFRLLASRSWFRVRVPLDGNSDCSAIVDEIIKSNRRASH